MAEIVLGIGASHTPQVNTGPEVWHKHGLRDRQNEFYLRTGKRVSYDELAALGLAPDLTDQLTDDVFVAKAAQSEAALADLRALVKAAEVDMVVVIGDDQRELFQDELIPCFGIFTGQVVSDYPVAEERMKSLPTGLAEAQWAFHADSEEKYEVPGDFATHIARHLMSEDFDIANATGQYNGRSLGHAFTYPRRRLFPDLTIPMVPIFVNTYYPPNRPTALRCFDFGAALGRAIRSWDGRQRVGVIATGGLSHFLIDEEFDKAVIDFLHAPIRDRLASIPDGRFISGTAEALNWIVLAAAVHDDLRLSGVEYIAGYRTMAGTGVGLAFAKWE